MQQLFQASDCGSNKLRFVRKRMRTLMVGLAREIRLEMQGAWKIRRKRKARKTVYLSFQYNNCKQSVSQWKEGGKWDIH